MRLRGAPLTVAALVALAVANAWLLSVALRQGGTSVQNPVLDAAPLPSVSETTSGLPAVRPAVAYRETLAHPVFFQTREPFVPTPPPPPPAPAKPAAPPAPADPGIVLGGVAIDSTLRKAYLYNRANPQGAWVSEGETFMGWTVQTIEPGATRLKQSDRELALELYPRR